MVPEQKTLPHWNTRVVQAHCSRNASAAMPFCIPVSHLRFAENK
jgi:hypothetical protein